MKASVFPGLAMVGLSSGGSHDMIMLGIILV